PASADGSPPLRGQGGRAPYLFGPAAIGSLPLIADTLRRGDRVALGKASPCRGRDGGPWRRRAISAEIEDRPSRPVGGLLGAVALSDAEHVHIAQPHLQDHPRRRGLGGRHPGLGRWAPPDVAGF